MTGRDLYVALRLSSLLSLAMLSSFRLVSADDAAEEHFEKEVRPLFIERCLECHNQDNDSGKMTVESREALLKGGETGPAIQPGHPEKSLLVQAIRRSGELKMPPEDPLSEQEIQSLVTWIEAGAVWPANTRPLTDPNRQHARDHWAFQSVVKPEVPKLENDAWGRNPIDAFILRKLREQNLALSPEADRRTLLRRISYSLTGLPPALEDVSRFTDDANSLTYEQLVDQFLNSDQYGEQWARHWLDVARYADTKGYVYAREERFWPHAWAYRDWVVRALNHDVPYNRFLLLQLAADQVEDREQNDLAAMGFLTLGRRFLGVNHLIIDDRIDVVCRGTMGLTVGCARCHDHKYDPIPTADYYSLYGVFDSSAEELVRLNDNEQQDEAFEAELKKRTDALTSRLAESRKESTQRARSRLRDYLVAQTELSKYPPKGFDQVFAKSDLLPEFVWKWERYLDTARRSNDPLFKPWHQFAALPAETFAVQAIEVNALLHDSSQASINALLLEQFNTPPKSFVEVISRYADLFEAIRDEADAEGFAGTFENVDKEAIRTVLYSEHSPCVVPDEPIVHTEFYFDSGTINELWKLQGEVDRWIINSPRNVPFALTMKDSQSPSDPQILIRGNPVNAGRVVPRQFLSVLSSDHRTPFQNGSGRYELARHIIDPANPLTARVIVNRVWTHHFGQGLVLTPSDFGTRAKTPSHPELLDWLADWFVHEGWSLKKLHRLILTSATYRQASRIVDSRAAVQASKLDPDNRLLWRMNAHRQTFEEFRDSLLQVSHELDLQQGGKPKDLFQQPFPKRRTIYGLVDRQYLPGTLRVFDFANPDLHIPKRSETTVPQQALFTMNHPIVLEQVRSLAQSVADLESPEEKVGQLFAKILQRPPTKSELAESLQFVSVPAQENPAQSPTVDDWTYGYGKFDEDSAKTIGFQALPHFTGIAWQGGPNWPDATLGWVQLTATGGHPGNTREHAAIRRWTAPQAGEYRIQSKLVHEPPQGDGIRTFIVSSRSGLIDSKQLHQSSAELGSDSILVEQGETIDFIVDIGDVLNSDQYLWSATIQRANAESKVSWNSNVDFTTDHVSQLSPWEQFAHLLICTNEFLFVD